MKKTCSKCKQQKGLRAFYRQTDARDGRKSHCKVCTKAANVLWLHTNKERVYQLRTERLRPARNWFFLYKKTLQCLQCGFNDHPAALDFHHRDPATKMYSVGQMWVTAKSIEAMKEEIAKCDVLCANCHRILHHSL